MAKGKKEPPKTGPFSGLKDLRDQMAKEAEEKEKAKTGAKPKSPSATTPRAPSSPSSASSSTRRESADEDLDFHRLMSGVTPLDDKHRRVRPIATGAAHEAESDRARADKQRKPRGTEADTTMEHLRVLVDEGSKFEVTDDGQRVEGHRIDVPPDFVRRLRRGGFPVDATLDLHGRSAGESREALEAFLRDKRGRGERCVLVVHGKGAHSPGGVGILRGEMSAWLSQGPASAHVAAFTTALEPDGGEGAVYVLLRR